jgi:hypothetical protein
MKPRHVRLPERDLPVRGAARRGGDDSLPAGVRARSRCKHLRRELEEAEGGGPDMGLERGWEGLDIHVHDPHRRLARSGA